MKDLVKQIKFSKGDRNIIVLLCLAIISSWVFGLIYTPINGEKSSFTLDEVIHELPLEEKTEAISVIREVQEKPQFKKKTYKKTYKKHHTKPTLSAFDPNTVDSLQLIDFGLKPWTVSNLLKYRRAGAYFYNCEDLSKIYSLNDSIFRKLLPFCNIAQNQVTKKPTKRSPKKSPKKVVSTKPKISINKATAEDLIQLRGIGKVFSERIIKYRDLLGGFHSPDQIQEVYMLEKALAIQISKQLVFDGPLEKINVNSDYKTIIRHPYLDKKLTKAILAYRKQHGRYTTVSQLKNIYTINDSIYSRISPYLRTE